MKRNETKIEIKSMFGWVLFEHSCEDNTIKKTLEEAVKARAYLADANLAGANLAGAYLADANLADANLAGANLAGADLAGAYLARADLAGADLARANLAGADLARANLARADLADANLAGANLAGAYLAGAKNADLILAQTSIVPDTGSFTAWKKCKDGVVVKLLIPEDAQRSNASSRKCRASKAQVLEVIGAEEGISSHDDKTIYRAGETVVCDGWDENRWHECSGGIHFFITRLEAQNYDV